MRIPSPKRFAAGRVWDISADAARTVVAHERALAHYRRFMEPGDLVFDLGANIGDRTAIFRKLGARVVAVDPQPSSVKALNERFGGDVAVTIVAEAVAERPGDYTLRIDDNDTLSTMSDEWMEAMTKSGRFEEATWTDSAEVKGTTLDELIDRHGVPQFCKIDVEGYERQALQGLTQPLRTASFEFAAEALSGPLACIERFTALGDCEFALAYGELMVLGPWLSAAAVRDRLQSLPDEFVWGDAYVRFST